MTNEYDGMLDEAEEMSEVEIAEKLSQVGEFDVDRLKEAFKDRPLEEIEAMEGLIDDLKLAADGPEKRRAWAALGISAGIEALRLAKKVLLATIVAICVLVSPARAGIFNIDNPYVDKVVQASKRTRGGLGVNLNAVSATVGYVPIVWDKKRSYWDLGFGVSAKKFNTQEVLYGGGLSINLLAMAHDGLKNLFGDRVGFLDLPGTWLGVSVASPKPDHIDARWDYKEKIQIQLTYAWFGGAK